jgi:hypothetical protein
MNYLYTGTDKPQLSAKQAGVELARLMERQLGYEVGRIDNVALRLFIRAYWSRVALYAHTIHDDNEDGSP